MKVIYSLSAEDHLAWFDHLKGEDKPRGWPSIWSLLQGADPARQREQFIERLHHPEESAALGPRTLELTEHGVRESGSGFDFTTPWSEISRVDTTETHVFIAHISLNAHVIPVRGFVDESGMKAFVARVQSKVMQPKQPPEPMPLKRHGSS